MIKLKTGRFKKLYKLLKTPFTPVNWLILGFLVGLEDKYISLSIKQNLNSEIHRYKAVSYTHLTLPTKASV